MATRGQETTAVGGSEPAAASVRCRPCLSGLARAEGWGKVLAARLRRCFFLGVD